MNVAKRWRDPFSPEPWAERVALVAPDLERDETILRRLQAALLEGDELADAVAAFLVEDRSHRAMFERAVDHGIDSVDNAPEVLRRLFAHVDEVPAWLDRARIARAKALAQRVGIGGDYVLSCFALLPGYLAIGTAKVLVRTGALDRMARRRLAETSQFVADVYAREPLDRFSAGVRSAIRVRVMHALVRRSLREGWDVEAYGLPINQLDQCGTNLLFSVTFTLGLRTLGYVLSKQEREDVVHLWRYVGRIMGIADDLLPANEREARRLLRLVAGAQQGPDGDDTRRLATALLGATEERWREERFGKTLGRLDVALRAGLTRAWVGDEGGDLLGLPRDLSRFALFLVFPAVRAAELARRLTPFGNELAMRFSERTVQRYLERALEGNPASYVPYAMRHSPA